MRITILFIAAMCLYVAGCGKNHPEDNGLPTVPPENVAPITDPVSWEPSVIQTNSNARQFNYGKVKIVNGLSVLVKGMNAGDVSSYSLHVYLRTSSGIYIHLPANSANGVAYSYYLKTANPNSTLFVTRTAGSQEIYQDLIILAAKSSFIQSYPGSIDFLNYGSAKAKLGL
ncbi:MAG: hypothetical protein V4722_26140 [Bacteroidota bacterium]